MSESDAHADAPFDILGELPSGTTVLEASAGTGKTWTVGALVARYVAEGRARLDEMLVVTFGRVASQELRERVRDQLVAVERALADPATARADEGLIGLLATVDDAEIAVRRRRLGDALATFDAATIATTHQFCQLVLRSLGVAGDTDAHATLVDNLDDLVVEVVDDLYLSRFGSLAEKPPIDRALALTLGRAAVEDPQARVTVTDPRPGSPAHIRLTFAEAVRAEVQHRKRHRGLLSYDDLLSRLADALEAPDSAARERMRLRWSVVLVDEFQDTDPVQWDVLERAFHGHADLVLIGDPKQAIYAFRGGDVVSYLHAAASAGTKRTLATNWRSDRALVEGLQAFTGGAELGDREIVVHPVEAAHQESRLVGAPRPEPLRLRVAAREQFGKDGTASVPIGRLREHIADDLAGEVAALLASDATHDGRPVQAGDVAVLMFSLKHAPLVRSALARRGIASVVTSGGSVFLTGAAEQWLTLLEALEQPHRVGRIRAAALTCFVGESAAGLDEDGDRRTDEVAEQLRDWLDLLRNRGIAAVHEAAVSAGLGERVLGQEDGERLLTDLNHLAQVMHEVTHRERLGLPALLEWFRAERRAAGRSGERTRRLDSDAAAVQLVTIHGSKGLQYPVVMLPYAFNTWLPDSSEVVLFHDEQGQRSIDVSAPRVGDPHLDAALAEDAGEELRLTYVALTRAQSQVVAWFGPSRDAANSGLARLLVGRRPWLSQVPARVSIPDDADLAEIFEQWQAAGAWHVEASRPAVVTAPVPDEEPPALAVRRFTRGVDTAWQRTSYSGLIRADEPAAGVTSEPEVEGTVDEPEIDDEVTTAAAGVTSEPGPGSAGLASPMAELPSGAALGSLVHGVLEHVDPLADDLPAELRTRVGEQLHWWPVQVAANELAEALLPMNHTSLGPLADGLRLVDFGLADRLRELDFEIPLSGGEHTHGDDVRVRDLATVLRAHLLDGDPMRAYAERLESPALGDQPLRGYLSGSIDVVLRVPDGDGHRYVVVDYKTNRLGEPDRPLTASDYSPELVGAAMLHSHYPLQALLYSVVVHRYLRWRQPGYDPERHLGGILYLYVRGMCGPGTPEVDGVPCGVFSWRPPTALILELSRLLDGERVSR